MSLTGLAVQVLPRHFNGAQKQQISAWEVSKRWRTLPAGDIFPASVRYQLPAATFDDFAPVSLADTRVGIAPQARCAAAADQAAVKLLDAHGCEAMLRATYTDETATYVMTVGVAVLPSAAQAAAAENQLARVGGKFPGPGVFAVPFPGTVAGSFGNGQRQISRSFVAGPYVIMYTAGYTDGRPQVSIGDDSYAEGEMTNAARGAARAVASALDAAPPTPSCPGTPGC